MKYRQLGRSGLKTSELCLGTMLFGGVTDETEARDIIDIGYDHGLNFIDTAEAYTDGRSEEIIGRALAGRRDEWVIATKALPDGKAADARTRGVSRKGLMLKVEGSLKRLGTDYLDIYYLHREDPVVPIAETVRTMGDLIRQGKIRYYGLSNHQAWRVAEFSRTADLLGIDRPVASQFSYNIADRTPEREHLYVTDYYGQGVVTYGPLARGVLTGKYSENVPPAADTRAGRNDPQIYRTEWRPESLAVARQVKERAEAQGISSAEFALAWVLNNGSVTAAIAGPRTREHWQSYLAALDYQVTPEDEIYVDGLVAPGTASTHGYAHPADLPPRRVARTEWRPPFQQS